MTLLVAEKVGGKRYIFAQKFRIELRISFQCATHAAYNKENHTFVPTSVYALYAKTRSTLPLSLFEILYTEYLWRNTQEGNAHNYEGMLP